MVIWVVRAIFIFLIVSFLLFGFLEEGGPFALGEAEPFSFLQGLAVAGCLGILVLGLVVDLLVTRKKLAALAGVFFGLVIGLLFGLAFNYVVNLVFLTYNIDETSKIFAARNGIKWLINMLCCYWAISFIMQTKDDFRFIVPYVEFSKQTKGSMPLLLDTSVIIDGRIADIAATKILSTPLIIPRFILNELHVIADSADRLRRNRGRRGLDILNKLQNTSQIDVSIEDIDLTAKERSESVDHKLVSAAQKLQGKVVTNDYNLNKVCSLRGVDVININDLAGALKAVVLPGENLTVKIVKVGDQAGQGIGYMDDGTMIVVEQGSSAINRTVEITVTSALQTSAGRMIFGKIESGRPNGRG